MRNYKTLLWVIYFILLMVFTPFIIGFPFFIASYLMSGFLYMAFTGKGLGEYDEV